jgi:hypothetical protein
MMFAPRYTVWHCGTLKKGKKEMNTEADDWANERQSNTPRTDALFFPYGRDATAAAEPSLLVCMTQYELLERENAALRERIRGFTENGQRLLAVADSYKEENAALRGLLERSKPAVRWCMGNEYDPTAKGAAAILLRDIDALLKEEGK